MSKSIDWLGNEIVPDIPERYVGLERYVGGEAILEAVLDDVISCPSNKVLVQQALNKVIEEAEADCGDKMREDTEISVHLVVKLRKEGDDIRPRRHWYRSARRDVALLNTEGGT